MRVLAFGLSFLLAASLAAQAPPLPKPGPEMAKLQALAGTWHVEEVVEPGPMGPGGKGHGTATVTSGPGGLSLRIVYKSESPKGPMPGFSGEGLVAWDAESKAYKQAWTDNYSGTLMVSTGHWDGDVLVMDTEGTTGGKPFKSRDRFTAFSPKGFTITTEMSMDGGPWQKAMTLVHTRK